MEPHVIVAYAIVGIITLVNVHAEYELFKLRRHVKHFPTTQNLEHLRQEQDDQFFQLFCTLLIVIVYTALLWMIAHPAREFFDTAGTQKWTPVFLWQKLLDPRHRRFPELYKKEA